MILKALYDYYYRSDNLPPLGYRWRPIHFTIIIDSDGHFIDIEDNREYVQKGNKSYLVSKKYKVLREKPRTSNIDANFLWDKVEYVLNYKNGKLLDEFGEKTKSFIDECEKIASDHPNHLLIQAIVLFYRNNEWKKVLKNSLWSDIIVDSNNNLSFKLKGSLELAGAIKGLGYLVEKNDTEQNVKPEYCLVTGKKCVPVRLCMANRIPKCGSNKPKLVSFMSDKGFDSYYKTQCYNAPISWEAAEAINIAIERLCDPNYANSYSFGNRTFLFWTSSKENESKEVESTFLDLFISNEDDPNQGVANVYHKLKSIWFDKSVHGEDDYFYVLGVYPNNARMVVVYWYECKLSEFIESIEHFYQDTSIIGAKNNYGIYSLLSPVTSNEKEFSCLSEMLVKSVLNSHIEYPYAIFTKMIQCFTKEISSHFKSAKESAISRKKVVCMVAFMKAYLTRLRTNSGPTIDYSLAATNNNIGYLCGRLFAVFDKIQQDATQNKVFSIREKYIRIACVTPAVVFSHLLEMIELYVLKLDKPIRIFYEKLLQEILCYFTADGFPVHLRTNDQGYFLLGFYQQREDFFDQHKKDIDKIPNICIDYDNTNIGYVYGRLFAVLDRIQELALGDDKRTIHQRHYSSCCTSPALFFPIILRKSISHIQIMENQGVSVVFEKLKQEIISKIGGEGFVRHLNHIEQGRFHIGYNHQRFLFFQKERVENDSLVLLQEHVGLGSVGYFYGSMMAVFDYIQDKGSDGDSHSIRDKYLASMAERPLSFFSLVSKLSDIYLRKISHKPTYFYLYNMKKRYLDEMNDYGIPSLLNMEEQGRFYIGYYHKKDELFKKSK